MTGNPVINNPKLEGTESVIECEVAYPKQDDGATFRVSWHIDDVVSIHI